MRHLRILTGLIAAAAMVLVALVSAPATADSVERAAAKPKHVFAALDAGKVRGAQRKLYVSGRVVTAPNKRVVVQRSATKRGKYRTFKGKRTTKRGKFKLVFSLPIGTHVRLVVPKTRSHRATKVYVGQVVRRG